MEATQLILKPIVTEKSTWQAGRHNTYVFHVHPSANKYTVQSAIEGLYNVKVDTVRIAIRKGKSKRTRYGVAKKSDVKRALVTLKGDDRIDLF